jgi:hypothetical protein
MGLGVRDASDSGTRARAAKFWRRNERAKPPYRNGRVGQSIHPFLGSKAEKQTSAGKSEPRLFLQTEWAVWVSLPHLVVAKRLYCKPRGSPLNTELRISPAPGVAPTNGPPSFGNTNTTDATNAAKHSARRSIFMKRVVPPARSHRFPYLSLPRRP